MADIHFAPKVAMRVAEAFEKIRVNPGNFVDGRKKFDEITFESDADYKAEVRSPCAAYAMWYPREMLPQNSPPVSASYRRWSALTQRLRWYVVAQGDTSQPTG